MRGSSDPHQTRCREAASPSKGSLLVLCIFFLTLTTTTTPTAATAGPQTTPVDLDAYTQILHVSTTTGSDTTGTGTASSPYASIPHALALASATSATTAATTTRTALLIAAGTYNVHNLTLNPNTDLYGGFDPTTWTRDIQAHQTILDTRSEGRVLIASNNTRLDGLHIQNGRIRAPGGGILIDGAHRPLLSNNVFTQNATQTPADWAPKYLHETAHDGGAIYCRNGGAPEIRNNLILANTTETGRGAGIAFDHNCDGLIADNVLIGNIAGTADPMRSSDGGGISIFNQVVSRDQRQRRPRQQGPPQQRRRRHLRRLLVLGQGPQQRHRRQPRRRRRRRPLRWRPGAPLRPAVRSHTERGGVLRRSHRQPLLRQHEPVPQLRRHAHHHGEPRPGHRQRRRA